ncbi:uncharacterized protein [Littorina saxatilis]|uniref:uncharacterized protein n=1 Tax=Littorina saxatilis TaxID=31220 RepID=UPI0038B4D5D2
MGREPVHLTWYGRSGDADENEVGFAVYDRFYPAIQAAIRRFRGSLPQRRCRSPQLLVGLHWTGQRLVSQSVEGGAGRANTGLGNVWCLRALKEGQDVLTLDWATSGVEGEAGRANTGLGHVWCLRALKEGQDVLTLDWATSEKAPPVTSSEKKSTATANEKSITTASQKSTATTNEKSTATPNQKSTATPNQKSTTTAKQKLTAAAHEKGFLTVWFKPETKRSSGMMYARCLFPILLLIFIAGSNLILSDDRVYNTSRQLNTFETLDRTRDIHSSFIRWGRKSCPVNSALVYAGVAGGKLHSHKGSGTNPLCLTLTPQFDDAKVPSHYGYLYGAEYETIPGHEDHNVPCSVCLASQSTTIMVPGTLSCPSGWTSQYTGHLVSQLADHFATEYVCLDGSPEHSLNDESNENGLLFYYVITVCGSLPCAPYINNRVVTCVVCSK